MDVNQVADLVRVIIARELEIDATSLNSDASLRQQYALDSVAAVNIIFHLEENLGISIDTSLLARVDSVRDINDLIFKLYAAP